MSSINLHYTLDYSQPEEYRFSHDSVFLARQVFELTQNKNLESFKVLDLCAGCGVVGLDFLFHRLKNKLTLPTETDFIEVQNVYQNHFNRNIFLLNSHFNQNLNLNFLSFNYVKLQSAMYFNRYDLVICNPPYFRLGHGVLSKSEFKNRCRFFIDSNFENLLKSINNCTKKDAEVYILLNSLDEHGIDVKSELNRVLINFEIRKLGLIRNTDFWLLKKFL